MFILFKVMKGAKDFLEHRKTGGIVATSYEVSLIVFPYQFGSVIG